MSGERKKILITPRSLSKNSHPALNNLSNAGYELLMPWPGRQPEVAELKEVLPSCLAYLAGVEPITAEVLELCKNLNVISRNGVGIDNIDLITAKKMGIAIKAVPGANAQGVAELALTHILSSFRSIAWSSERIKKGTWDRRKGREITGKTLGIIGCGQIGERLARMAVGIGMKVIGYDLYHSEQLKNQNRFSFVDIDTIKKKSDVISLHCPPGKKALIDNEFLSTCKKGVRHL